MEETMITEMQRDYHRIAEEAIDKLGTDTPCVWSREEVLAIGIHIRWLQAELRRQERRARQYKAAWRARCRGKS